MMIVTVVIRARNCAGDLSKCLAALASQALPNGISIEPIVVDNESEDETPIVARSKGARVVSIPRLHFSWGRALNYGIREAVGEYVILLSADAHPVDACFVANILRPFDDLRVGSVYGRQIPRPDAPIDEVVRLKRHFPQRAQVFEAATAKACHGTAPVSNACAAIRRSLWSEINYDEELEAGEERVWTELTLQRGYISFYEPKAEVYHSHNDPLFRKACRSLDFIVKYRRFKGLPLNISALIRWLFIFAKSRVLCCLEPGVGWRMRVNGFARLPAELAVYAIVFALLRRAPQGNMRSVLWDLRLTDH